MRSRILIISFFASLPLWIGVNIFADNFNNIFNNQNQQVFLAQSNPVVPEQKIEDLEISAKSAVSVLTDKDGNKNIFFEKNADEKAPIASLTKIMSSDIILENIDLSQDVIITDESILGKAVLPGSLKPGESFKADNLFLDSYIESDNNGITALANLISGDGFVELMNLEAKYLGLENTYFFNPTGLDAMGVNFSTAKDMAELSAHYFKRPLASDISLTKVFNLYTSDGIFHHTSINTNEMLDYFSVSGNFEIIGGKTGYTSLAGECLVLVLENKENNDIWVNIILGSEDRFKDMEKMIDWVIFSRKIK